MKRLVKTFRDEVAVRGLSGLLGLDETKLRAPGGTSQESLGALLAEKAANIGIAAVRGLFTGGAAEEPDAGALDGTRPSAPGERETLPPRLRRRSDDDDGVLGGIL